MNKDNNIASTTTNRNLSLRSRASKLWNFVPHENRPADKSKIQGPLISAPILIPPHSMLFRDPNLPPIPVSRPTSASPTYACISAVEAKPDMSGSFRSSPHRRSRHQFAEDLRRRFSITPGEPIITKFHQNQSMEPTYQASNSTKRGSLLKTHTSGGSTPSDRQIFDLELKALRQECESVHTGKKRTSTALRNMTGVLSRIREFAAEQTPEVANVLENQADSLESLYSSAIEGLRSDSPILARDNNGRFRDSAAKRSSVPLLPEIQSEEIAPNNLKRSSSTTIVASPLSASLEKSSPQPEMRPQSHLEQKITQQNAEAENDDKSISDEEKRSADEFENTLLGDAFDPGSKHNKKGNNDDLTLPSTTAEDQKHEEETFFCSIGPIKKAAPAQRPLSRAQANRHSSIIGDSLFRLSSLEDNNKSDSHITRASQDIISNPLPDAHDKSSDDQKGKHIVEKPLVVSRPGYATAITKSQGRPTLVESPSEDSPTMSCSVRPSCREGAQYVRQKIAVTKGIVGRSSLAAYRGRLPT